MTDLQSDGLDSIGMTDSLEWSSLSSADIPAVHDRIVASRVYVALRSVDCHSLSEIKKKYKNID